MGTPTTRCPAQRPVPAAFSKLTVYIQDRAGVDGQPWRTNKCAGRPQPSRGRCAAHMSSCACTLMQDRLYKTAAARGAASSFHLDAILPREAATEACQAGRLSSGEQAPWQGGSRRGPCTGGSTPQGHSRGAPTPGCSCPPQRRCQRCAAGPAHQAAGSCVPAACMAAALCRQKNQPVMRADRWVGIWPERGQTGLHTEHKRLVV